MTMPDGTAVLRLSPQRQRVFAALSVVAGLVFGLLVLECGFRLAGPTWLRIRMSELERPQHEAVLGSDSGWPAERQDGVFVRWQPHQAFRMENVEYSIEAHTDEWGGRTMSGVTPRIAERLLPFLGDSFTFGVGVEDNDAYVSILGRQAPRGYRYLNLGVPGSALPNHLDILERRHEELGRPPAYVFNFFSGNDLRDMGTQCDPQPTHTSTALHEPGGWLWNLNAVVHWNPILRRLYSLQFLKARLLVYYNRGSIQAMDPFFATATSDELRQRSQQCLARQIERLARDATTLRFAPLFVLIPDRYQVYPQQGRAKAAFYGLDPIRFDLTYPNTMLVGLLSEHHIDSIDILECMRSRGEGLFYVQDGHLTPRGHQMAAQCLAAPLQQALDRLLEPDSQG